MIPWISDPKNFRSIDMNFRGKIKCSFDISCPSEKLFYSYIDFVKQCLTDLNIRTELVNLQEVDDMNITDYIANGRKTKETS